MERLLLINESILFKDSALTLNLATDNHTVGDCPLALVGIRLFIKIQQWGWTERSQVTLAEQWESTAEQCSAKCLQLCCLPRHPKRHEIRWIELSVKLIELRDTENPDKVRFTKHFSQNKTSFCTVVWSYLK